MDIYEEMMVSITTAKATAATSMIFAAAASKARTLNSPSFKFFYEMASAYKKEFDRDKAAARSIISEIQEGE